MSASAIGAVLAGPACGAILKYVNGVGGLHGWQWLFILEGLPACVLAVATYCWLDDGPARAAWLRPDEKDALARALRTDDGGIAAASHGSAWQLLKDRKVYGLSLAYLLFLAATYTMVFASPGLIKHWGVSDLFVLGMLSSLPHACAVVASVLLSRHSDRRRERRWHLVAALLASIAGVGLIVAAGGRFETSLVGLTLATMGWVSFIPLIFATTADYLPKVSAAAGIALVSSLGNLGAAVGAPLATWLETSTGDPAASKVFVIGCWIVAALVVLATLPGRRTATNGTTHSQHLAGLDRRTGAQA
jgi:MFS family permease